MAAVVADVVVAMEEINAGQRESEEERFRVPFLTRKTSLGPKCTRLAMMLEKNKTSFRGCKRISPTARAVES